MTFTQSITISESTTQIIDHYFTTFNNGDFSATAALFSPEAALFPPFEQPVLGREAIASYLHSQAFSMKAISLQRAVEPFQGNFTKILVKGKVETPIFSLNVAWEFVINQSQEIYALRIKLLATLEELAQLPHPL